MTAKGKINASNVKAGNRIIVWVRPLAENPNFITESPTKTGEGRQIVRVLDKIKAVGRRGYEIFTSAGVFYAEPIQTMWLAPEDPAGIKRAHAEALELDKVYEAYPLADEDAEVTSGFEGDEASDLAQEQTSQVESWLASHRVKGTPRTQWSPVEDARQADHAEALEENARRDAAELIEVEETKGSSPEVHTGSTVIRLLERVWERIRTDHPELPQVVIVTGSGEGAKWGHFRADSWKVREEGAAVRQHELFLASEALAKGANQVLQTMLHEAAHTLARVRDQKDTSRQGRWHNQIFRKTAEEMGLVHLAAQADKSHGFAFVTLTERTKTRYADLLEELGKEIRLTGNLPSWLGGSDQDEDDRGGERMPGKPAGEDEEKAKSTVKCVCRCEEPNIIRMSAKVQAKMTVRCDDCQELFLLAK